MLALPVGCKVVDSFSFASASFTSGCALTSAFCCGAPAHLEHHSTDVFAQSYEHSQEDRICVNQPRQNDSANFAAEATSGKLIVVGCVDIPRLPKSDRYPLLLEPLKPTSPVHQAYQKGQQEMQRHAYRADAYLQDAQSKQTTQLLFEPAT